MEVRKIVLHWWEGDEEVKVYYNTNCPPNKLRSIIKEVQKKEDYNTDDFKVKVKEAGQKIDLIDLTLVEYYNF